MTRTSMQPTPVFESCLLERLDWTPACELGSHPRHPGDEAARYVVQADSCPCTGAPPHIFSLCLPGWVRAGATGLSCVTCGVQVSRDEAWTILLDLHES